MRLIAGAILVAAITCAHAQVITTVAGTDFTFPHTPLPAINAPTGGIFGVAVDTSGNVFFSDYGNTRVFKMDPNGVLTVVAGNGAYGFGCYYYAPTGDGGPATGAALSGPWGLAVDAAGNLFIADQCLMQVRKVTPAGIISNVAGNGALGYSGDGGPALNATFGSPSGITLDSSGNLFIADAYDNVIRKVTPDGIITTVAGNGTAGDSGDGGPATSASLDSPFSVAVDSVGNLFIADEYNSAIRKVTPAGIISTVAGTETFGYSGDGGPATSAALGCPFGVTLDSAGNLFVADGCAQVIRKITPAGIISTVAGTFTKIEYAGGYSGDGGPATSAQLNYPAAVAVDVTGNLFIADAMNHRIRKVTPAGIINTVVGNGNYSFSGDGGPAISATLNDPSGLTIDAAGDLFIADTRNNRIRKVTPAGIISTVAGGGTAQSNSSSIYPGEGGPATSATLLNPLSVAVDGAGDLFIADTFANAIRKVTPAGIISTVIRLDTSNLGGVPFHVVVDSGGNLFIADTFDSVIRKLTPLGYLSIVAGEYLTPGYSGDGGPAVSATLNYPTGLALDTFGNLFIGDSDNNVVRKVTPAGIISTVAGNGMAGYSGDGGLATNATLYHPRGVAVDAAGNLFISDRNSAIRKVTPAGIISTVAGNGTGGYSGDGGLATSAVLNILPDPSGQPNNEADVAVDAAGNLFIADTNNNRVREVLASRPGASVSPRQLQFSAASNGAPTTPQTLTVTSPVDGVAFSITTDADWLQLNPSSGGSPRLIQVIADPTGLAPMTYHATINISTPNASPIYTLVAVTFNVTAAVPPTLSIDKASLSFPFPQQGSARSQTITVSNAGSGALQFTATATTTSGGNWLSASPAGAQALPGSPVPLTVTANPTGLSPGAYSGQVMVAAGAQSQTVAVTMTISKLDQAILLSQSGLSFLAVQSGGIVPTQSFGVQNIGTGVVNWTVLTSTLAGGPDWLQVTPASGSSDAAAETSPRVTVSVNGSALPAGTYYGLVRVDAPGAANTPQVLTVFLQVLPADANVAGVVQPAQLVFTATAGGESPGSQLIQVYNIVAGAKSFQSQVSADTGLSLITSPGDATLDPQQPASIVVQPITTGLGAGVYNGAVTLQFSDGTVSAVKISVIVSNTAPSVPASNSERRPDRPADSGTSCTPSKLLPALTTLGQTFTVSAGWPAALVVNVKDDCGMPMPATGSVMVSFSNGDPALLLQSQGGGSWENTWSTGNATTGVTLTILANSQGIKGAAEVTGNLASQEQPPAFDKSGIVSIATPVSFTALAPGSAISIFGSRLAESTAQFQALPLPTQLVDTQLFVSGTTAGGVSSGLLSMPLYYVSQNQVNAIVPYEVSVDTTLQLLVQRGTTLSVPVQIDMAQAQPAVFSSTGAAGSAGLIYVYPLAGGPPHLVSSSAPAHAGDTIVLYCTGLGLVNPVVTDGAAPQQLTNTAGAPELTIGGQSTQVKFAGLAPGFAGLYQVNAVLPSGTQTGASVSVTLTIDGQTSPPITMAIE